MGRNTTGPTRHGEAFWDEAKNGKAYQMMRGMGWSHGKGLGRDQSGRSKYVSVHRKKNNAGIGATGKAAGDETLRAVNSIYNNLLQRLGTIHNDEDDNKSDDVETRAAAATPSLPESASTMVTVRRYTARHHLYSKFRRAKDVSRYSEKERSDLLGANGDTSDSSDDSDDDSEKEKDEDECLQTTSSTNIHDYFKNKLQQNGRGSLSRAAKPRLSSLTGDFQERYATYLTAIANPKGARRGLGFGGNDDASDSYRPSFSMGGGSGGAASSFSMQSTMTSRPSTVSSTTASTPPTTTAPAEAPSENTRDVQASSTSVFTEADEATEAAKTSAEKTSKKSRKKKSDKKSKSSQVTTDTTLTTAANPTEDTAKKSKKSKKDKKRKRSSSFSPKSDGGEVKDSNKRVKTSDESGAVSSKSTSKSHASDCIDIVSPSASSPKVISDKKKSKKIKPAKKKASSKKKSSKASTGSSGVAHEMSDELPSSSISKKSTDQKEKKKDKSGKKEKKSKKTKSSKKKGKKSKKEDPVSDLISHVERVTLKSPARKASSEPTGVAPIEPLSLSASKTARKRKRSSSRQRSADSKADKRKRKLAKKAKKDSASPPTQLQQLKKDLKERRRKKDKADKPAKK